MRSILRSRNLLWPAATGICLLSLGGCPLWSLFPSSTDQTGGVRLRRFNSAPELLTFLRQQAMARNTSSGFGFRGVGAALGLLGGAPAAMPNGAEAGDSEGGAYSTTNLQEAGVDESDVFKSDGVNFYIGKGRSLRIVRASPAAQMEELARLDLGAPIDSLYLDGGQAIVLMQQYGDSAAPGLRDGAEIMIWPPYDARATVRVAAVDVSNPRSPRVVAERELDGVLVSSRLTNNRLILVLTFVPPMPPGPLGIALLTLDDVLPRTRSSGTEQVLVPLDNWYRPESPDGYYTTAVVTLDASDVSRVVGATAVMAEAGTIYATTQALYLTDTGWGAVAADDGPRTIIHKLKYNADGVAEYAASGAVPGRPINQFSLGEHEGYLRIATEVSRWSTSVDGNVVSAWSFQQYAGVYVLGEVDGNLEVVGKVENIAPGETVHASRFLGDHGFLVTFRRIDPLFILDLTDPTDPRVVAELTMPGFSDYLHPVGDTHLIGVGKWVINDNDFDWYQGLQLSLFDVSDWSNPRVIQQIQFGGRGSESDVLYTHKAFTFMPDSNLLAVPMQLTTLNDIPWEFGDPAFDGVVVFRVDPQQGFTELGRINAVTSATGTYEWWWGDWRRGAFIGQTAYAVTPDGVRSASLDDFTATSSVTLAPESD